MCTATWRLDPQAYTLFFNRDELRSRRAAKPPQVFAGKTVSYIAPTDPESGGTWIMVNPYGICAALLNRYPRNFSEQKGLKYESRGKIPLAMAGARSLGEAVVAINRVDARRLRPFTLLLLAPESEPAAYAWDGKGAIRALQSPEMPLSSSSFRSEAVIRARREHFKELLLERGDPPSDETLMAFHSRRSRERPAFSVCMSREDAQTQSLTVVKVEEKRVCMRYIGAPPCEASANSAEECCLDRN
jgi:uncharacterized protein with NRDE domain